MYRKNTDELQEELMDSPDLSRFLRDNRDSFRNSSFSQLLQELFDRRDISKATLAKRAGMSEVYLHQLFAGGRNPSRNRILCLCLGLSATLEETQDLLVGSGNAALYARERRDAIILYGLLHGLEPNEVNDLLFSENEKTLF